MDLFVQLFLAPLQETYFIKALIGGSIVAMVSGVVGSLVILRRMAFLGDALSHAMIAGVAGGYLFMKVLFGIEAHAPAMLIGSLIAAILTVALISFVSRVSRVKEDTSIGIMYTGIFASGVVAVSIFRNYIHIDLMHFIMGDVLGVADVDLWASAIASSLVLSVILLFFRHFQLSSFDPVMAASIGMPILLIDYALTSCVSLVVVSAVSMVGVILVVGLLITPAATAYLLSDRLDRMMILSALFGVTSVIGGLYLCAWLDSSGGGAIMLFCTLQFLVILFLAPRYGILSRWQQLRQIIPQEVVEDILLLLIREKQITFSEIESRIKDFGKIKKAVHNLVTQGLLQLSGDLVSLTESGIKEAKRFLRAHRLWEAYLAHVGTSDADIHPKAHVLEHMHDASAINYLDDLLGHPLKDPHGQEIPEDDACKIHGNIVPLSMLRNGKGGTIDRIQPSLPGINLKPGEKIRIQERRNNGKTWVAIRDDGKEILLNHEQADAITVKCG